MAMKGIETIAERILADARAKANAILQEADEKVRQQQEESQRQAEADLENARQQAKQQAEELRRRNQRTDLLESKKQQLAARQQLLDEAYDRALQRLTSLDDKAYLELLCTLCSQAVSQSGGELLLNQKDQARCGQELVRMVREKTGAQVTLSQQTASIPGWFILRQGKVEVNCALDAVVRAQAEQTAKDVAAILF